MKTNNIQPSLLEGLESRIKYQYSTRMFCLVAIYLLVAVASVIVLFVANIDQRSPLYFIFGLLAFFGILMAVTTFSFQKKEVRLSDSGAKLICRSYHFDASVNGINEDIRNHRFDHLKSTKNNVDSGVRLDVLYADDASEARYRLYKYIPFEYQPVSDVVPIDAETAHALAAF